jgi:hypothetical protein
MNAYIAPEQTGSFMIYQSSGTGYYPMPKGPQCAFMARPDHEWVTVAEIEAVLNHLRFSAGSFVEFEAACQIPVEIEIIPSVEAEEGELK